MDADEVSVESFTLAESGHNMRPHKTNA